MNNQKFLVFLLAVTVVLFGIFLLKKSSIEISSIPNNVLKDKVNDVTEKTNDVSVSSLFKLPEGFSLGIFSKNVPGARVIEMDPKGRILVSQTSEGKIVALNDTNNDSIADEQKVLASGLAKPHGMAFECWSEEGKCYLYIAEKNALSRYLYDADTPALGVKEKLISISSSVTDRHFTRSLVFLPYPNEDTLLISVGSSCDVCHEREGSDYGKILSYNIKTGAKEIYARGLRNAVFMTLDPIFGKVFATEMGRDNLGDNLPPDEINIIEKGKNYGWPTCYGKNIHDTVFDKNTYIRNPCLEPFEASSFVDLQAHSAPLGLAFIPEEGWPEDWWYNVLVAYHGSWNRTIPTGYKIVRLKMNSKGEYLGTEDFITGWLTSDGEKSGRPVDIKVFSGGVAYISDDSLGIVYKLFRHE